MLIRRINHSIIKRPLCYSLAGFLLAYFLCGFFESPLKLTFSLIFLYASLSLIAAGIIFRVIKRKVYLLAYAMILVFLSLGLFLSFLNFDSRLSNIKTRYDGVEADVNITVISAKSVNEGFSSHEVIITGINGEKCRIKANMVSTYLSPFEEGESICLPVKISQNTEFNSLAEASDISHGYLLNILSEDESALEVINGQRVFPYSISSRLRQGIKYTLLSHTDGEGNALSRALVYGDRSALSRSFTDAFRELGLSHMLAISGMHFSITVGLLAIALSKMSVSKRSSLALLTLFVLFYALISGFSASVCRAAIMLLFSYASFFFGRRADAVTSLFCSAFIICMFSPYAIYDLGLILSFLSTLGILMVAVPVNEAIRGKSIFRFRAPYYLASAMNITLSAVLFTLPISYFSFGYLSYVSPITNIIFSPIITLILYLLPFVLIFSPIPPVANIIGGGVNVLSKVTFSLAEGIADSGELTVSFDERFSLILLLLTLISLAAIIGFYKNLSSRRAIVYLPLISFVLLCYIGNAIISYPYDRGCSVAYYTENENDAIIISSGKEVLFCDLSSGNYPFTKSAMEYGESTCKNSVSAYMISDYHYTHIATVTKLVNYTDVRTFILPVPKERDRRFHEAIVAYLELNDCDVKIYENGKEKLIFGEVSITPYIHSHESANPASIMLIESETTSLPTYAYFSNTKALPLTSRDFRERLENAVSMSDTAICGSHGDSERALEILGDDKIIRYSFYSGIKN